MHRKLYLHAGIHRTGTTHLQQSLCLNRDVLAAHGLIYPFGTVNHEPLLHRIIAGEPVAEIADEVEAAASHEDDAIILSSEDFCTLQFDEWLETLKQRFDVQILLYIRRQDHWLSSWYNQNTKWPFDPSFFGLAPRDYLGRLDAFHWLDYASLVDRWANVLGADAIHLGVVGRGQIVNVLPDFLAKVGMPATASLRLPENAGNESVSPYAAEVLRHLLPQIPPIHYWSVLQGVIEVTNVRHAIENRMVFSPAERRGILAKFAPSNETVAEKYLGRSDGKLFLEPDVSDFDPWAGAMRPLGGELVDEVVVPLMTLIFGGDEAAAMDARQMVDRQCGKCDETTAARWMRFKVAPMLLRVLDRRAAEIEALL